MPAANVHSAVKPAVRPMSVEAVARLWHSRTVQVVRNKLFYEFAIFILGGGNTLIIWIFWPGWILFGLALWAFWQALA